MFGRVKESGKTAINYINTHAWLGNTLLGIEGAIIGIMFALAI